MLDAFIIEQLRREQEPRRWSPLPLELPLPPARDPDEWDSGEADEPSRRGVLIIEPDGSSASL